MEMLKRMEGVGLVKDFTASNGDVDGLCVSHLLYVVDTILFYDASIKKILYIQLLMTCFEAVVVENMTAFADLLRCRVGRLPMTYLGMPLTLKASFKSKSVWNPILGKYGHRLAA